MSDYVLVPRETTEVVDHFWRLSLVIESAVRRADPEAHDDVLALILKCQELQKSRAARPPHCDDLLKAMEELEVAAKRVDATVDWLSTEHTAARAQLAAALSRFTTARGKPNDGR